MSVNEIPPQLPGYQVTFLESGLDHSRLKLSDARHRLHQFIIDSDLHTEPCENEEDTVAYRCSCAFQILQDASTELTGRRGRIQYAMRQNHKPVLLGDSFPIANQRIQQAMKNLLDFFNQEHCPQHLLTDLCSISFVSSWCNELDCVVKLNYSHPIQSKLCCTEFLPLAESLRVQAQVSSLLLSSKNFCFILGNNPPHVRDVIKISFPRLQRILTHRDISVQVGKWNIMNGNDDTMIPTETGHTSVFYHKKADAFLHPNRSAMQRALQWILEQLWDIVCNYQSLSLQQTKQDQEVCVSKLSLLEMYCGCGAHTVAIAKTGWLEYIVAVERDKRLIEACLENCSLNQCQTMNVDAEKHPLPIPPTPVHVIQGCAGEWAKKYRYQSMKSSHKCQENFFFQILLVDPPKSGLDVDVRGMMKMGPFEHILYISCGIEALQRDLEELKKDFEVEKCLVLDLFPRTDSVETLVHLTRRRKMMIQ